MSICLRLCWRCERYPNATEVISDHRITHMAPGSVRARLPFAIVRNPGGGFRSWRYQSDVDGDVAVLGEELQGERDVVGAAGDDLAIVDHDVLAGIGCQMLRG